MAPSTRRLEYSLPSFVKSSFGGRRRSAQVRLEQVIADAFAVLETEIAAVGAQVSLPETDTQVTVDQAEIQEVIINLLQNSLYWLRQVPQDTARSLSACVAIVRTRSKLCSLTVGLASRRHIVITFSILTFRPDRMVSG